MIPMATEPHGRLTIQEYLALERESETRNEYLDGEMYAMSGASRLHNLIAGNVFGEIRNQLKGRSCEAYQADLRVLTPSGLATYPDVVALCGEPAFDGSQQDTLLNPGLIVEVLSPTTEGYDRKTKSPHYRSIPSLAEYILVSQDRVRVERFQRQGTKQGTDWLLIELDDLGQTLELPSIGCRLTLAEIYDRVFPA
jgi:Uma2 family endonuclease